MVILCDGSAHLRRDLCDVRVVSNYAGCATDGMIQRENAPMLPRPFNRRQLASDTFREPLVKAAFIFERTNIRTVHFYNLV